MKSQPSPSANLADIRRRFEQELDRSRSLIASRIDHKLEVNAIRSCMLRYLETPGKRLRPLLFLATLQALEPDREIDSGELRMACGLELFHEFILIHDDLIDRSESRRGAPTLWRRLESETGLSEPTAKSAALIAGDILFASAIEHFATEETSADSLPIFLRAARETGWGAVGEIATSERSFLETNTDTIEAIYHAKTTRYTFEMPMLLAARVCRAPEIIQVTLAGIARPMGLAFQLENDLHELIGHLGGRSTGSDDAESGIKTLPMVRFLELLSDEPKEKFAAFLDAHENERRRTDLADLVAEVGLIPILKSEINDLFRQPETILSSTDIDSDLRERLTRIVQFLSEHRNHSEALPENDESRTN